MAVELSGPSLADVERHDGVSSVPEAAPCLAALMQNIGAMLRTQGDVGVILIDLGLIGGVEAECGAEVYNQLIDEVLDEALRLRGTVLRAGDVLCRTQPMSEELVVFLDAPRHDKVLASAALESVADRVWAVLAPTAATLARAHGVMAQARVGYSLAVANPMIQTERLVYRAIDAARAMSRDFEHRVVARGRERLRNLLAAQQLTSVFQPIVQLDGGRIRAYEALIRGPSGSDLESPLRLFGLAAETGLVAELDRASCHCALARSGEVPGDTLLFLNVMPALVNDASFRTRLLEYSEALGSSRIVLELAEGVAIRSYDVLGRGLAELRGHGVALAIDDFGAGHASFDRILRLQPDYLKLDMSVVRGVHESVAKRALIQSLVQLGGATKTTVIAEGVEHVAERDALASLGVSWAQGYLFARPSPTFVERVAR